MGLLAIRSCQALYRLYFRGARSFFGLLDFELDLLVFLKGFEARKQEQAAQIEQSNMAVDQATEGVPAPAAEKLGPEKKASAQTNLFNKLITEEK